jgi:DNA-directed RNA polymerase subunit RPC12/RpoP
MSEHKCPNCGFKEATYKFKNLYQCGRCKQHFYDSEPTKEEREASKEEKIFQERIKERQERVSTIEQEVLRLAAEMRQEELEKNPEFAQVLKEAEETEPEIPKKVVNKGGRPRKVR